MANSYADNVCAMLRRRGLADKYEHPGIYCIKVEGQILYIGKSENMLKRVAYHYVGIQTGSEKKYRLLSEIQRNGHKIEFDVLYYAQATGTAAIREEIGSKEGEFIRQYLPVLNTQIPRAEDWHKWDKNTVDAKKILQEMLQNKE